MRNYTLKGACHFASGSASQSVLQPNTLQAEILYGEVRAASVDGPIAGTALDLYCGTGTIGLSLAHLTEQVIGIELNEDAVVNARKNASDNQIENASRSMRRCCRCTRGARPRSAVFKQRRLSWIHHGMDCRKQLLTKWCPSQLLPWSMSPVIRVR